MYANRTESWKPRWKAGLEARRDGEELHGHVSRSDRLSEEEEANIERGRIISSMMPALSFLGKT